MITQISPAELQSIINQEEAYQIVDVRQPEEFAIFNIGGDLIPLAQLDAQVERIRQNEKIILVCKSGTRSNHAADFLQLKGFDQLYNLSGGLSAWVREFGK